MWRGNANNPAVLYFPVDNALAHHVLEAALFSAAQSIAPIPAHHVHECDHLIQTSE
jgi:hypothetical protein